MSKSCLVPLLVLLVLVLGFGGCGVSQYNGIVSQDEAVSSSWSEIQNQYKRRADLVPNLVKTVQGAADFEKSTITEVTEARASVGQIKLPEGVPDEATMQRYLEAQKGLGSALSRLLVVAENYPQLKATSNFADLQTQLEGTENRIAVARRDYIDAVKTFNGRVRRFPGNLIASLFGFERKPQLEFEEGVAETPQVNFPGQDG